MADELAYAVVTPYTIRKSRTGAVIARLLGRTSCELIAARIFALDRDMAESYSASVGPGRDPDDEKHRQLIREYILESFSPDSNGRPHRSLMLIFKGANALDDIRQVVGSSHISSTSGETIRDTFGDLVLNEDGSVRYFEPGVLISDSQQKVAPDLELWLDFADRQPNVFERICTYDHPENVQKTLVLIKPDSWQQRSSRPGTVIDMFSRTGLRIIGLKLCRLSVGQALRFYGPVRDVLCRKLAPGIGEKARHALEKELSLTLKDEVASVLGDVVGVPFAEEQFERIIQFMTGRKPSECPGEELESEGFVKCLAVVYEGEDAVRKIRDVLGPTDPTKAPWGTVRREFGSDVMVNAAHASDSPENAERELGILNMTEDNFREILRRELRLCGR